MIIKQKTKFSVGQTVYWLVGCQLGALVKSGKITEIEYHIADGKNDFYFYRTDNGFPLTENRIFATPKEANDKLYEIQKYLENKFD